GDVQGGTTKEGIHMGVMSGTLDLVQRAYAGAHIRDGILCFDPRLPEHLDGLSFVMQFERRYLRVGFAGRQLTVATDPEAASAPVRVSVRGDVRELSPGERATFELGPMPAAAAGGRVEH